MNFKTMRILASIVFLLSFGVFSACEDSNKSTGKWQQVKLDHPELVKDFYLEALYYSPKINAAVFIFGESSKSFIESWPTFGHRDVYSDRNGRITKYVSAKPNTLILMSGDKIVLEIGLQKRISPEWQKLLANKIDLRKEVIAIANDAAMADPTIIEQLEKIFAESPRRRYAYNSGRIWNVLDILSDRRSFVTV